MRRPKTAIPARSWRSPVNRPDYRGTSPPNKGKKYPPEPLTRAEAHALVNACSSRSPSGIRNRALIVVMWRGMLRVSEALALMPKDVDPAECTITVLRGKGAKRRVVGIDPDAMAYVTRWLDVRARLGLNGRHPLFCTIARDVRGGPMNDAYVRDMVKERARKAGIEKRVHPHGLRHTGANELSLEGTPLKVIQAQLGHADPGTTDTYINHLTPRDVVDVMRRRRMGGDQAPGAEALQQLVTEHGPALMQLLSLIGAVHN